MTDISINNSLSGVTANPFIAATGKEKTQEAASTSTQDNVSFSDKAKNAGKTIAGAAMGTVFGTLNAIPSAVEGSTDAALKALGIPAQEGFKPENLSKGQYVERAAIRIATVTGQLAGLVVACAAGAMIGGVLAPVLAGAVGVSLGGMIAPGVAGGLISAGKGAVEGAKVGFKMAKEMGESVGEKATEKFGKTAGKVAKYAAMAGMGAFAIPTGILTGSAAESIEFASAAARTNTPEKENCEYNSIKSAFASVGYLLSFIGAGEVAALGAATATVAATAGGAAGIASGFGAASAAGAAVAGGAGTLFAGLEEGLDGFEKGFEAGMDTVKGKK
jgi:hypothetical protein